DYYCQSFDSSFWVF
nr:immunoglobulin light chain junction region [Macaca mulatta]MOX17107.1 immunoglobulin light chain junction region [Macaca mulatta]MOX17132.1 immunoglobulin light chain junction region [Macaca mulatta]MOX17152.1 immunoglobulin light chain junction region [Macaca mulatta]MOX17444.1 immunoglobulin light chain junction region [Macaca mulatta]